MGVYGNGTNQAGGKKAEKSLTKNIRLLKNNY